MEKRASVTSVRVRGCNKTPTESPGLSVTAPQMCRREKKTTFVRNLKLETGDTEEAAEYYLSTGELRPVGDLEFPFSMLLDTAMLCEQKWGIMEWWIHFYLKYRGKNKVGPDWIASFIHSFIQFHWLDFTQATTSVICAEAGKYLSPSTHLIFHLLP